MDTGIAVSALISAGTADPELSVVNPAQAITQVIESVGGALEHPRRLRRNVYQHDCHTRTANAVSALPEWLCRGIRCCTTG